ncbi:MAG: sodium/solute symporter [Deltaproteobacteria bacterium]|nr:sodium/solute symporter [Deltaproteobacteria bacterium]
MIDAGIIFAYFAVIMVVGWRSRSRGKVTADEYFLSSRSLKWPSIAVSTIATNISAGHFISVAGSAYVFGLAQANLELNAIFGILMAVFVFVPLYLRAKVTTISQFFEDKFGPKVALAYSTLMMVLYACLYLGMSLFWASYAIDSLFGELVGFISTDQIVRLCVLVVALGSFSAFYTYLGGLSAVVRTDAVQFVLLVGGGLITVGLAMYHLGGPLELWELRSISYPDTHPMHLHLPASDPKLPWVALIGMNLLNLNYWGANQVILQRALAARSLRHAQVGLLVGGLFKYLMVLILIIPAIALIGIHGQTLDDPDQAYSTLINTLLPTGLRGLILCGLFASLMSTVDSIFNSVSTLWSVDIYKRHLRPEANDEQVVAMGKKAILGTLFVGVSFAFVVVSIKSGAGRGDAFTHWFNELSYYIKNGFVLLICAAVFLIRPSRRLVLLALATSIPMYLTLKLAVPELNYFVRAAIVIATSFLLVAIPTWLRNGWRIPLASLVQVSGRDVGRFGVVMAASLVACHIVFH